MSVTLVVPNHHEPMIEATVQRLLTLECLVVVTDDPQGRGVGWALREGLAEVTTRYVLFAMADGSENVTCLRHMLNQVGWAPAVWGDRWLTGSVTGYPRWKRICNRAGNHLIGKLVSGGRYSDWTDLAKLYETDKLRQLSWSDDFRCAVEIPIRYYRAFCTEHKPLVVPMYWTERTEGKSAYKLSHALGCLRSLWTVVIHG